MPHPFTSSQMFCAGPIFLSQPKNLTAYSASEKHFVPEKKMIGFSDCKIFFDEALNAAKFLGCLKKCGPAQTFFGPIKGQGISCGFVTFSEYLDFKRQI